MTKTVQNSLSKIHYLLSEANIEWGKLPIEERVKINDLHEPSNSLGYCLSWGTIAANEARDYAENE